MTRFEPEHFGPEEPVFCRLEPEAFWPKMFGGVQFLLPPPTRPRCGDLAAWAKWQDHMVVWERCARRSLRTQLGLPDEDDLPARRREMKFDPTVIDNPAAAALLSGTDLLDDDPPYEETLEELYPDRDGRFDFQD